MITAVLNRLRDATIVSPPGLFRLVLALAVVVSHATAVDIGRLAVLLFFYLSGFWVSTIWTTKFGPERLCAFLAGRWLRVMPLYLLVMLGAAALRQLPIGPINFALLGVGSTDQDPTGVSWSLDVEMQFYLLFPLLILALHRLPDAALAAVVALLAVVGWWLDTQYAVTTVAKYLPAFFLGVLTFTQEWRPSERGARLSLLGFLAMSAVTAATPFLSKVAPDPFDQDIWAFLWMLPLLPYVARSLRQRSSKLDRDLGNLSFPLYLVHFPLIAFTAQLGLGGWTKYAAVAVSVVVAVALYKLFDRPVDAWRLRVTEGRATGQNQAPVSTPSSAPIDRRRFAALDGLRGVAAFGVVIGHAMFTLAKVGTTLHFHLAVDFFFMLSGFVVAYAYANRLASGLSWRAFVGIRLKRLYPLLFLGVNLGFAYALIRGAMDQREALAPLDAAATLARGLLLIPGANPKVGQGAWPLDVPTWSLFYEFIVNLAWAAVAVKLTLARLKAVVAIGLTALVVAAIRFGNLNVGHDEYSLIGGLARVAFSFPMGLLLFELRRRGRLPRFSLPPLVLAVLLTAALVVPTKSLDPWYELVVILGIFPLIVIAGLNAPDPEGPMKSAAALAGEVSYPLYIVHFPVLLLVGGALNTIGFENRIYIAVVGVVAALGAGLAGYWFYDRPMRRLFNAQAAAGRSGATV